VGDRSGELGSKSPVYESIQLLCSELLPKEVRETSSRTHRTDMQIHSFKWLFHTFFAEDSKGSPEAVTHLRWDDPYYDIARHHIVEVAGNGLFSLFSPLISLQLAHRKAVLPFSKSWTGWRARQ